MPIRFGGHGLSPLRGDAERLDADPARELEHLHQLLPRRAQGERVADVLPQPGSNMCVAEASKAV